MPIIIYPKFGGQIFTLRTLQAMSCQYSYFLDECLCPFRWQSSIGTVVILLTWLEFIVLSTQFQFIGVYVFMLSKVLATFLKIAVLMCILIAGFSVVFYLSLNDPNTAVSYVIVRL